MILRFPCDMDDMVLLTDNLRSDVSRATKISSIIEFRERHGYSCFTYWHPITSPLVFMQRFNTIVWAEVSTIATTWGTSQ